VVLYYFDTVTWGELVPIGVAFVAVAFLTGWAMDRLSRARRATGGGVPPPTSERWIVHLKLAALVVLILGAALAVERLLDTRLFLAVTLTVPVVAVAWTVAQHRRFGPRRAVVLAERRVRRMAVTLFPSYRIEFVMLAGAGFAGTLVAAAISPETVTSAFAAFRFAPVLIAVLVVWAFMLMGLVGLNPLVSGTIIGAALRDPAAFGLEPLVMAAAMAAGWGVTASFSPFTSPAWGTSRLTGKDAWTVTLRWNGAYNLVVAVLLSLGLVLLDAIVGG
jgi:hypothetical protein